MDGQQHFCSTLEYNSVECADIPVIQSAMQWLDAYFSGRVQSLAHIPLLPAGTSFQRQVWDILSDIPYGETVTYGQVSSCVAAALGKQRMSAQAIGSAIGRNPISILIPCHRVIGAEGGLTGYAGGIARKAFLLQLEQRSTPLE